jgi:ParB family transcriptional regulator, chromosome partitioning protein
MELTSVKQSNCRSDPNNRQTSDPVMLRPLGESMKAHGQQIPIIAFRDGNGFVIVDGHRRWGAAGLVGIEELTAIILPERPSPIKLRLTQFIIDEHYSKYSTMDRSCLLHTMKIDTGLSVTQLAEQLKMKQPLVSRLLGLQRLCDEAQKLVRDGGIDQEKAFIASEFDDPAKQVELLKQASVLTRDQLRRKAHNGETVELKAKVAKFPLPSGTLVVVRGREMTLTGAIDALQDVVKELKQSLRSKLDIVTASCVMRDKAKETA